MKDSKDQYPAQTGKYAVKVKNGGGWSSYDTARFHISVGQPYHEGDKFLATIEWAKVRFSKVIICVNDTLQRYNYLYQEELSEAEAIEKSEQAGREWIERNIATIRRLPDFEIYRWEYWLSKPEFKAEHDYVTDLYAQDEAVWDLINKDVSSFWQRRLQSETTPSYSFADFKEPSIKYLLEETAAFFLMFRQDAAVDIYPGSTLLPCVLGKTYCKDLKTSFAGKQAFTRIDFVRKEESGTETG